MIDDFRKLACGTLSALVQHIASRKTASFSNMPPLVFFYKFEDDKAYIMPQPTLTTKILEERVSECHYIVRSALEKSTYEGLIVSCKASRADVSGVSRTNDYPAEAPDNIVMFIFSKRFNDGACLSIDLSNPEADPALIDASSFGNNLDLLISPQH